MGTELARLGIKVESADIKKAVAELKKLEGAAESVEKEIKTVEQFIKSNLPRALDKFKDKGMSSTKATMLATRNLRFEWKKLQSGVKSANDKAGNAIDKTTKKTKKLKNETKSLEGAYLGIKSAVSAFGAAFATKKIINQISVYQSLENRLKLVTNGTIELAAAQENLFNLAQKTRGSYEGTIDLYARLARSTQSLNLSSDELLTITEAVNNAVAISGTTAASAEAALFQLGQGIGANALRGQELNSVMEQTPELARALAAGLGIEFGNLKKFAEQGGITAEAFVGAMKNQAGTLRKSFGETKKTVSQAMQLIENAALKTFGSIDGSNLVKSMDDFRVIISDPEIAEGLQTIAAGMIDVVSVAARIASGWGMIFKAAKKAVTPELNDLIEKRAFLLEKLDKQIRSNSKGDNDNAEQTKRQYDANELLIASLKNKKIVNDSLEKTKASQNQTKKDNSDFSAIDAEFEALDKLYAKKEADALKDQQLKSMADAFILSAEQEKQSKIAEIKQTAKEKDLADIEEIKVANSLAVLAKISADEDAAAKAKAIKDEQLSQMAVFYNATMALAQGSSKKLFNLAKAASLSQAVVSSQAAIVESYKNNGGYPAGIPAALAMAATSALNIKSIQSQKFSGQAHAGLDKVPSEGTYLLKKGEMVLDSGTSEKVRNNAIGSGGGNVTVEIKSMDSESIKSLFTNNRDLIFNTVVDAMNESGRSFA